MSAAPLPAKSLSKSKLSMFLRTGCDRELYLSLFIGNQKNLEKSGIPIPLKSRPGVQLVTKAGTDFENTQYAMLVKEIGSSVIHKPGFDPVDLEGALKTGPLPRLILQPEIKPEEFRGEAFTNLTLTPDEQALIPQLQGMRPDVILVRPAVSGDWEVLPTGARKRILPGDTRIALSVIDLKNVTEANPSYSAEVCLYAFFVANWIAAPVRKLNDKYYVSHQSFLWTNTEQLHLADIIKTNPAATQAQRIEALLTDLTPGMVDFLVYMPSVRKFFKEDLPKVIESGDKHGWQSVMYHVNPKCNSCDWLGHEEWLNKDDKVIFAKYSHHYCSQSANTDDLLCKLPGISRGAGQVLVGQGINNVVALTMLPISAPVLRQHTFLKRERSSLPARASAITTGVVTTDTSAVVGTLARSVNLELDIAVNFDAGSGYLTGISLRGFLFAPYGKQIPKRDGTMVSAMALGNKAFVVAKDCQSGEWAAISSFVDTFVAWVSNAEKLFNDAKLGSLQSQLYFWELRQYQELCNAFGRHFASVIALPSNRQKALAWLFPPEELLEKETGQVCPAIVFVSDIVQRVVRNPQLFANTLLGVANNYCHPHAALAPWKVDSYYREPLGSGIPRERIYEIWKCTSGSVKRGDHHIPLGNVIDQYGYALRAQAQALGSIVARLRSDFKSQLKGKAVRLDLTTVTGATGVAYDSKLWNQWAKVDAATARVETVGEFSLGGERLEASYKAIILTKLISHLTGFRYEYGVSEESTEAKLEEGGAYYVVGVMDDPGFPLKNGYGLKLTEPDVSRLSLPMHRVIAAALVKFDRAGRRAIVEFRPRWSGVQDVFDEVFSKGHVDVNKPLYLMDGLPYDDSKATEAILAAIGDPPIATTAKEALVAMGKTAAKKVKPGTTSVSPAARVLWDAGTLSKNKVRSRAETLPLVAFANSVARFPLDKSQEDAITHSLAYQLSVIWGPPGTGKTDTLTAMLHTLVHEATSKSTGRNILITGPNYRAVEELAERLVKGLSKDPKCPCDFFWVYSRTREPTPFPTVAAHIHGKSVPLAPGSTDVADLVASIGKPGVVTIVATSAQAVPSLVKICGAGSVLAPLFDVVVIDESSQVPLTLALRPLSVMRDCAQLVVTGDHFQMPPISNLEPPLGAEYLVGSVQAYLIKRFGLTPQELLVNYRSNEKIVEYAKTLGYPLGLKAANPARQLKVISPISAALAKLPAHLPVSPAWEQLLDPAKSVCALVHEDTVSSQANALEAKIVAALAYVLRHTMASELDDGGKPTAWVAATDIEFFEKSLGVVTPHKAQKALVLSELRKLFPAVPPELIFGAVDTVERFQGGQRHTIIVSFGVGDVDIIDGEEHFLLQMERTNVAVSRAMAKCIVLMPKALAYHLPTDPKAAATSMAIKSYVEEFCANRLPVTINDSGTVRAAELRWH